MEQSAGERARNLRPQRLAVVPAGNHKARACKSPLPCHLDHPAAIPAGRSHAFHSGVRANVRQELPVGGVGPQVFQALLMVGMRGPFPRHGKIGVGGEHFGADEACGGKNA